ncbi:protein translocase subunit SecDF [Hufsiella ginkgonis]|uniref:Multifunctional fusion protein n=1 Tax=Hufsiella ginkgonis TaxID=2695274 RepID=A0A7K1XY29_9SPHI|nr:protein translocase subunit SecDF [Hufsiella ginkgonis]MXV15852.1 protein translocase subunit SecDF [Hufsiella ginkgonis]
MQGKGLIKVFTIVFAIICLYCLSFTWLARKVENDAEKFSKGDNDKYNGYLDSVASLPVLDFPKYITYQYAKAREIPLGLDLKGGMNVTMEISLVDLVRNLANSPTDPAFNTALNEADKRVKKTGANFIEVFADEYKKLSNDGKLSKFFATTENAAYVKPDANNSTVISFLKERSASAISNSFNILRTRIDKFGVTSPNIQLQEGTNRILIELPGVKDPLRVRKLLQGSAALEFWETYDNSQIFPLLDNVNKILASTEKTNDTTTTAKADTATAGAAGKLAALGSKKDASKDTSAAAKSLAAQAKLNPLFAKLAPNLTQGPNGQQGLGRGPVVGYAAQKDTADINRYFRTPAVKAVVPSNIRLLWGVKPMTPESKMFELYAIRVTKPDGSAALKGSVVIDARDDISPNGDPEVTMYMNAEGAREWRILTAAASADQQNKQSIAIVLDDLVYSAPTVQNEIPNGTSSISGNFQLNDTKDLANVLKAGRLPAKANIVSEYQVGASLGEESIRAGMISSLVGIAVILIFMALYYSQAGWVANVALVINLFFLMGVLASFGAVLTLPGIAGIVLSLGMSVDANVLIYERVREELAEGKGMRIAIATGFQKAMSSILDSNITTFLTGLILFAFGTGPIQGFATTLMIGIITSLFSAIFITRLIFEGMLKKDRQISFSIKATQNLFKDSKFDFISGRRKFYALSTIIIVAGIISMFTRGFSLGVDFKGGRSYFVQFDKAVDKDKLRDILNEEFKETSEVKTYGKDNEVKITTPFMSDSTSEASEALVTQKLNTGLKKVGDKYVIMDAQKVGPTIAKDIKTSAVWAVIFSILGIFLYILARFRRYEFGLAAIVALLHDVLVLLALFSLLNGIVPFALDIDQVFIGAILTVMGYSINDTVVVFDRVREYIEQHHSKDESLPAVINNALNSTLSRTVITGLCTMAVLIIIFIFGGETLRGFSFAMLIGVIFGTYSSLFVATPFVVEFQRKIKEKV